MSTPKRGRGKSSRRGGPPSRKGRPQGGDRSAGDRRSRPDPGTRTTGRGKDRGLGGRQVEGRHAVRELLIAERRTVHDVWIAAELEGDHGVADIVEIAAARRIPVSFVGRTKLDREARTDAPQGVLAHAAELPEADLAELLRPASGRPPFLVAVDGVTDPGNLGAIIRNCDGAGVSGILLPRHRAVHVTPTVTKSSAGAVEYVPMALVPGLPTAIGQLQDHRIWVIGLDDAADRSVYDLGDLAAEPICVVLGAEGEGLSRLVRTRCDALASIPMRGGVSSLNVSAAAALATYEIARVRRAGS
jgi:23S rRNA (guanosine2251-2'-O)-methyltransferase